MGRDDKKQPAPHVPAAYINAIADEGTKAEAVKWLQTTWNELCAAESRVRQLERELAARGEQLRQSCDEYRAEHGGCCASSATRATPKDRIDAGAEALDRFLTDRGYTIGGATLLAATIAVLDAASSTEREHLGALADICDEAKNREFYKLLNETAGYLRMSVVEPLFGGMLTARAPALEDLARLIKKARGLAALPNAEAQPHEPPMVYDPQQGKMVRPGGDRALAAYLRALFDKTAEAHSGGEYADKVNAALVAVYAYGRRHASPSHVAPIACRGCEGRERDLCLDKKRCQRIEAL